MIEEQLRALRTEKNMTQAEVAEALGLQTKTYSTYECGTREPSAMTICKIALLYNVSADYVLGRTKSKNFIVPKNNFELSAHEVEVIKAYHNASKEFRDGIDRMLGIEPEVTENEAKKIV